jgi:imidazolonepropionase-like amidohydrolase
VKKRLVLGALGAAAAAAAFAVASAPLGLEATGSRSMAVVNARILDARTSTPAASLVIRDGVITAIGGPIPGDLIPFDAGGRYVVPGLIDLHAHMMRAGRCGRDEGIAWDNVTQIPMNFDVALRFGHTTVVDLGGPLFGTVLRDSLRAERTLSPRYLVAGPILTAPGGYPLDWADRELVVDDLEVVIELADEASAIATIDRLAAAGVDLIKIATMELAYNERPLPVLDARVFAAAVEAAHERRLRVFVHAHSDAGYLAALDAGADVIAHSAFDPLGEETIARTVTSSVVVVPTLWVFASFGAALLDETVLEEAERRLVPGVHEGLLDFHARHRAGGDEMPPDFLPGLRMSRLEEAMRIAQDNLQRLSSRGAVIGYGSDTSFCYAVHGQAHRELAEMARAGLTPRQAFAAATLGSARALGRSDLGRIEPGSAADLLILDGNPLLDTGALARPWAVVRDGRLLVADPAPPGPLRAARVLLSLISGRFFGASDRPGT